MLRPTRPRVGASNDGQSLSGVRRGGGCNLLPLSRMMLYWSQILGAFAKIHKRNFDLFWPCYFLAFALSPFQAAGESSLNSLTTANWTKNTQLFQVGEESKPVAESMKPPIAPISVLPTPTWAPRLTIEQPGWLSNLSCFYQLTNQPDAIDWRQNSKLSQIRPQNYANAPLSLFLLTLVSCFCV